MSIITTGTFFSLAYLTTGTMAWLSAGLTITTLAPAEIRLRTSVDCLAGSPLALVGGRGSRPTALIASIDWLAMMAWNGSVRKGEENPALLCAAAEPATATEMTAPSAG